MLRIVKRKTSLNKRVCFMSESKLRTQSTVFAVSIIGLVKSLKGKHETIISNQIGRSGSFRLFSLLICHLYVLHQFFQCLAFFLPQRVSLPSGSLKVGGVASAAAFGLAVGVGVDGLFSQ